MAKVKQCKHCGSETHSSLSCFKATRKPVRRSVTASKAKKVKTPKKKAKTRSYYVKKLDSIYSQYIRLKDSRNGMAECVTCGEVKPWKDMQNGHYMSRAYQATRWLDMNCNVQCVACNVFKKGNYTEYAMYMINLHGPDGVEQLMKLAKTGEKITTPDLKARIIYYTEVVERLLGEKRK